MSREVVTSAVRVVVKVGSSSLTTAAGGIDPDRVRLLVDSLIGLRERIQTLGGQFSAGRTEIGGWAVQAHLPPG